METGSEVKPRVRSCISQHGLWNMGLSVMHSMVEWIQMRQRD